MLLIVNQKVIIHMKIQSNFYILVTGDITATPNNAATQVVFKDCTPFKDCRTEIVILLLIMQILLILQCLRTI